jgi:hypothetical protein
LCSRLSVISPTVIGLIIGRKWSRGKVARLVFRATVNG